MKDFSKRTLYTAISVAVVVTLVAFADLSWMRFVVAAFICVLSGVAIWEYKQFAKEKGSELISPMLIAIGLVQTLSFFVAAIWFSSWSFPLFIFFLGFLSFIVFHFKQKEGAIIDLATSSFGLLYIAVPMGMILGILYGENAGQDGKWWMAFLLIVTKISDIGAYLGGGLLGKRKLAPLISPGKTIEGALIGLLCAIGASLTFYVLGHIVSHSRFHLSGVEAIVLGLVLGCMGQFGDLAESLLKRDANKKDSNVLPGFGGVLDLIDSLFFNSFIIFFYLNFVL